MEETLPDSRSSSNQRAVKSCELWHQSVKEAHRNYSRLPEVIKRFFQPTILIVSSSMNVHQDIYIHFVFHTAGKTGNVTHVQRAGSTSTRLNRNIISFHWYNSNRVSSRRLDDMTKISYPDKTHFIFLDDIHHDPAYCCKTLAHVLWTKTGGQRPETSLLKTQVA